MSRNRCVLPVLNWNLARPAFDVPDTWVRNYKDGRVHVVLHFTPGGAFEQLKSILPLIRLLSDLNGPVD